MDVTYFYPIIFPTTLAVKRPGHILLPSHNSPTVAPGQNLTFEVGFYEEKPVLLSLL